MRSIKRCKSVTYLALITLIGTILLVYRWTNHFKNAQLRIPELEVFQVEQGYHFLSEIDSQEHPYCKKIREEYSLIERRDGDMDIAFTITVHNDVWQLTRFLRMIYRINNYYCIHPDSRMNVSFVNSLQGVANCFGKNVELVPQERRIEVTPGDESVLKPQLVCGEQALRRHSTWKYLINTEGDEFPLRTNLEIIAALKALNGSNLIEGGPLGTLKNRVENAVLPLQATWVRGSIFGAFRREFIYESTLGTSVAEIREFIIRPKFIEFPDELYFSTLAYNPRLKMPGSCINIPLMEERGFRYLGKFVISEGYNISCQTKYVQGVCILGTPQIPVLQKAPHLFANKFHADYHSEAYTQLERWYFKRISKEQKTGSYSRAEFDPRIYAIRSCSLNHLP